MNNSIQQFLNFGTKKMEKAILDFLAEPKDMATFVEQIRNSVLKLALDVISETLSDCDNFIKDSAERKRNWNIVKTDNKQLVCSIGTLNFSKTLYINKKTRKRAYLVDRALGLEAHERLTEDAEVRLLEEAADSSYKKAGDSVSVMDIVSKQTTMNKIHTLQFPVERYAGPKRLVDCLYIDADEDHVARQFNLTKNDLRRNSQGRKINSELVKLVYVYEGIEDETASGKRRRIINPHYFGGVYKGDDNGKLWDEINAYIMQRYEFTTDDFKIYLNGDGGSWIKTGVEKLQNVVYVLDEFHIMQAITKLTRPVPNSNSAKEKIIAMLKEDNKHAMKKFTEQLADGADSHSKTKEMLNARKYLLNNWKAAHLRLSRDENLICCSAEGHVSHILSERLSSRPMGWSVVGMNNIAKLRIFKRNNGSILALVRKQRALQAKAVGSECIEMPDISRCWKVSKGPTDGDYIENMQYSVSKSIKRRVFFQHGIWLF